MFSILNHNFPRAPGDDCIETNYPYSPYTNFFNGVLIEPNTIYNDFFVNAFLVSYYTVHRIM